MTNLMIHFCSNEVMKKLREISTRTTYTLGQLCDQYTSYYAHGTIPICKEVSEYILENKK